MKKTAKTSETALALLDSSLITQTKQIFYNIKMIDCKSYIKLYFYPYSILREQIL
jgi:hypothetical protein